MDAVEFLKEFGRLCAYYSTNTDCKECPLLRYDCCRDTKNEDVTCAGIVEQWAKEHPVKTRQSEFLKLFPEASVLYGDYLNICPAQISSECRDKDTGGCYDPGMDCGKCKRDFWLKEIE